MRLPALCCVEVEVTHWTPQPASFAAFRALASEMRLYSQKMRVVVFVIEFERTVVKFDEMSKWIFDDEVGTEGLWRDV